MIGPRMRLTHTEQLAVLTARRTMDDLAAPMANRDRAIGICWRFDDRFARTYAENLNRAADAATPSHLRRTLLRWLTLHTRSDDDLGHRRLARLRDGAEADAARSPGGAA